MDAEDGRQRAVLHPARVHFLTLCLGALEAAEVGGQVGRRARRGLGHHVFDLAAQLHCLTGDIARPLDAIAMPDDRGRIFHIAVAHPVRIAEQEETLGRCIACQNIVVQHLTESGERDRIFVGRMQRIAPVAVVPPAVHTELQDVCQILGVILQLRRVKRLLVGLVRVIVEQDHHPVLMRPIDKALHIREILCIDGIARAVLARAPLGVDDEDVEREAVCTIVFHDRLVVGVRPVLIAAVPRAEGLDVRDRRAPGDLGEARAQRLGIAVCKHHINVGRVIALPAAVGVGRTDVCSPLLCRDDARVVHERIDLGRVAGIGQIVIEARRAHLLRRGLRHGPDELAVRIEDLDRIRMVAAVGIEPHRIGRGLGDETVPLGARLCRNAGEIAAPGGDQTDAILKAVIALLFHADHRIGQQHHARRIALQRGDARLCRRE